jgi:hypothetical protein
VVHLDFSAEERELLKEMVEVQLSELRMEIAGTDSQDFREGLKKRKAVLLKLQESLAAQSGTELP